MSDFDIKVLLAQAKNDPRFQNITTNGLRMGSTALSNDPIVSGVDGGNAPLLFNIASNTPGLFDVAIDIFIKLQEEILNNVSLSTVLEKIELFKKYEEFIDLSDLFSTEFKSIKTNSIETVSRFNVIQDKDITNVYTAQDIVDKIQQNKQLTSKQTLKTIIEKKQILEFFGRPNKGGYANYEFAKSISRTFGTITGLGRDFGQTGAAADQYYDLFASGSTSFSNLYWQTRPGAGRQHPYYQFFPLNPVFQSTANPPFWNHNNGGFIYWWMPGYSTTNQGRNFISSNEPVSSVPIFSLNNRDQDISFNYILQQAPWVSNFNSTGGANGDWRGELAHFLYPASSLPKADQLGHEPGALVEFISEILELKKASFERPKDLIAAVTNILTPKSRAVRSKIEFEEYLKFFRTTQLGDNFVDVKSDLRPHKVTKGIIEFLIQKELVLTPKLINIVNRTLTTSLKRLKISTSFGEQRADFKSTKSKKVAISKRSENVKTLSNLLLTPTTFRIKADKLALNTRKAFVVEKIKSSSFETKDLEFFKMHRRLFEEFDIKDIVSNPVTPKIKTSRVNTLSTKQFDTTKPISGTSIDTDSRKTFDSIKSLSTSNTSYRSNIVHPRKPRIESDKVFLVTDIDFNNDFKVINVGAIISRIFERIVEKETTSSIAKIKDKSLFQGSFLLNTDSASVISRDRDAGGAGDVFFTFKPFINKERLDLDTHKVIKDITKPLRDQNAETAIKIIVKSKTRDRISRAEVSDDLIALNVGKLIIEKLIELHDDHFIKVVEKPLKSTGSFKDIFLLAPADSRIAYSMFFANDDINPRVLKKRIDEMFLMVRESISKKYFPKRSIDNTLSFSEQGHAWMRDEEYTKGPYFLQPYVAAIPPGRSRQF